SQGVGLVAPFSEAFTLPKRFLRETSCLVDVTRSKPRLAHPEDAERMIEADAAGVDLLESGREQRQRVIELPLHRRDVPTEQRDGPEPHVDVEAPADLEARVEGFAGRADVALPNAKDAEAEICVDEGPRLVDLARDRERFARQRRGACELPQLRQTRHQPG